MNQPVKDNIINHSDHTWSMMNSLGNEITANDYHHKPPIYFIETNTIEPLDFDFFTSPIDQEKPKNKYN